MLLRTVRSPTSRSFLQVAPNFDVASFVSEFLCFFIFRLERVRTPFKGDAGLIQSHRNSLSSSFEFIWWESKVVVCVCVWSLSGAEGTDFSRYLTFSFPISPSSWVEGFPLEKVFEQNVGGVGDMLPNCRAQLIWHWTTYLFLLRS